MSSEGTPTVNPGLGLVPPPYRSLLVVHTEYHIYFTRPRPRWWFRLWYRLLLGWKWSNL